MGVSTGKVQEWRQASMKVPPKRKGNLCVVGWRFASTASSLNESPSEKEGKLLRWSATSKEFSRLNESPSEKEGKLRARAVVE